MLLLLVSVTVALFAIFPLTDTDIWWHLACAREWVTTWTPVREPVVNVHEFFQETVAFVYSAGGATLLVAFKAILWGCVFALFLWPSLKGVRRCGEKKSISHVVADSVGEKQSVILFAFFVVIIFIFRYQFEIRPVLFSLLFLGVYWNALPWLFREDDRSRGAVLKTGLPGRDNEKNRCDDFRLEHHCEPRRGGTIYNESRFLSVMAILALQWIWCKCQGLYILGPIFTLIVLASEWWNRRRMGVSKNRKTLAFQVCFVTLLFLMPFFHRDGLNLFLYPFGLLDRLLGLSPSAAVFASEIAENRSPFTLLTVGENVLQSALMIVFCVIGIAWAFRKVILERSLGAIGSRACSVNGYSALWLLATAILALIAERNFVLFLPVFFAVGVKCWSRSCPCKHDRNARPTHLSYSLFSTSYILLPTLLIAFVLGLWVKSFLAYDSMVAYQRVPVAATEWMKTHPHQGKLFNDDRAGGYLAFMNPSDSIFIDGRFILKTADFFERYLRYSQKPQMFLFDADSLHIDRVVLPLRYYARWDKLLSSLDSAENWHIAYRDLFFVVMDCTKRQKYD